MEILDKLPEDIANKIRLYYSHPTADIMKPHIEHFNEMQEERKSFEWNPVCHFSSDWFYYNKLNKGWRIYEKMEEGFEKHKIYKWCFEYAGWNYLAGFKPF